MVGTAIGCKACITGAARSFWSLLSFLFGQGSFLGYQGFQAIELCFGSASKGCCSFTSMTTQQKQTLINCFVKFGLRKVLVMLVKRFQHLQPTLCAADACNGQMFCCPQSFTTQSIQKAWARQVLLLVFKTGHWQDHFHGIQQVYHRMLNLGMDPWHPCWCSKNCRPASFSWNTAIPPTGSEAASGYSEKTPGCSRSGRWSLLLRYHGEAETGKSHETGNARKRHTFSTASTADRYLLKGPWHIWPRRSYISDYDLRRVLVCLMCIASICRVENLCARTISDGNRCFPLLCMHRMFPDDAVENCGNIRRPLPSARGSAPEEKWR